MTKLTVTGIVLAGLLATATPARATSIVNGGFETGTFDGWTVDPASTGSLLFIGGHSHSGADAAWFGAMGGRDDAMWQSFDTTPGESYLVSFWLGHGATDASNDFSVWWDATPLLTFVSASKFGMTQFSFIATALDDATTLKFKGRERVNYYYLDDVSVTYLAAEPFAPSPTPEPGTLALVLGGVAALAGRSRLLRKKLLR